MRALPLLARLLTMPPFDLPRQNRVPIRTRATGCFMGLALTLLAPFAHAQTWADDGTSPRLRELVAVDRTGEANWPFGSEDVAGDGASRFEEPERAADLRSAYARVASNRFWVRVYVSSGDVPDALDAYVFLDTDRDSSTGGSARAPELDPALDADPSAGGYELVLQLRSSPATVNAFRWVAPQDRFEPLDDPGELEARAEAGSDIDPLQLGLDRHGYLQAELDATRLGLGASCAAVLFFRSTTADGIADLELGSSAPCNAADGDADGVPDLAETDVACEPSDECPAGGVCEDGRCSVSGISLEPGEVVQGGAFTCRTALSGARHAAREKWLALVGCAALLAVAGARRRARGGGRS